MNLRFITFIGPLPPPFGGVSVINASLQRLNYRNFNVVCFNTSHGGLQEDLYKGFPWQRFLIFLKKIIQLHYHLIKIKPEVVNVFVTAGFAILRDIVIIKIVKWEGIPCIVHFHSKKQGEFVLKESRLRKLGKFFNKNADRIVLLSQDHFDFFTNYFNKEKCTVIENFVFYQDYDCRIELKTADFLYVGRLSVEKGFFDLLEAVHQLQNQQKNIIINVIGLPVNEKINNQIMNLLDKYSLNSSFVFHGAKFGQDKLDLFHKSKMLIFPSHFENSPLVLKEAIAAKMGIIASGIEANRLILNNRGNTIWHQAEKPQSLANAILDYLERPDDGISLCEASSLIKEYDSSIAEEAINSLIAELI